MLRSYKLPRLRSAKGAEAEEPGEGVMEQGSFPEARWGDWAADAPWDSFANHDDPVGVAA